MVLWGCCGLGLMATDATHLFLHLRKFGGFPALSSFELHHLALKAHALFSNSFVLLLLLLDLPLPELAARLRCSAALRFATAVSASRKDSKIPMSSIRVKHSPIVLAAWSVGTICQPASHDNDHMFWAPDVERLDAPRIQRTL